MRARREPVNVRGDIRVRDGIRNILECVGVRMNHLPMSTKSTGRTY